MDFSNYTMKDDRLHADIEEAERFIELLDEWRKMIQDAADQIWTSPESREVWEFFGHDADHLSENWRAYTLAWILKILLSTPQKADIKYSKYLKRFVKKVKKLKQEMRVAQFQTGLTKYQNLLSPSFSTLAFCTELADGVSHEKENNSVLFHIIRERADLICRQS